MIKKCFFPLIFFCFFQDLVVEMMDLEQRTITCSHCHGTFFDPEALVNHIKNVHCNIRLAIVEPTAKKSEAELPIVQQDSNKKETAITKLQLNKVLDDSVKNSKVLTNIKCTLCSETFTNYEELNHNLSWTLEDSEKDFICQFCRKMFKKKKCLVYHLKSDHPKLLFMAISPKSNFDNSNESVAPQVDLPIIQKEIKKSFENSPTRLQKSLFGEKLSSPKNCNLCFEYFSNKESYKSHVKTIAEDANRLFFCQFCDKVFKKRQCLISHLKSIHKKGAMNSSSNIEKQKNSSHEIENPKPVHQKSTTTMENVKEVLTPKIRQMTNLEKNQENYSKEAKYVLKSYLAQNSQHPYPSKQEKSVLARKSGLNMPQITAWFLNERRKLKKISMQNKLPFHLNIEQNVKKMNKTAPIVINGNENMYEMKQNKGSQYQMRPNHHKLRVSTVNQKKIVKENMTEKGEINPNNIKTPEKPYKCIACGFFFADQDKIRLHLLDAHGISV